MHKKIYWHEYAHSFTHKYNHKSSRIYQLLIGLKRYKMYLQLLFCFVILQLQPTGLQIAGGENTLIHIFSEGISAIVKCKLSRSELNPVHFPRRKPLCHDLKQ